MTDGIDANPFHARHYVGPRRGMTRYITVTTAEALPPERLPDDWQLVLNSTVNIWLVGRDEDTQPAIAVMRPQLQEPIVTSRATEALVLPTETDPAGTLILVNVGSFAPNDQERLHTWLEHRGNGVRVVSTSREPMMPMIEAGLFLTSLYYRLNTAILKCG